MRTWLLLAIMWVGGGSSSSAPLAEKHAHLEEAKKLADLLLCRKEGERGEREEKKGEKEGGAKLLCLLSFQFNALYYLLCSATCLIEASNLPYTSLASSSS